MNRKDFFVKVVRYLLFFILAIITWIVGGRITGGSDCSACPGNGICKGEIDCSKFLSDGNNKGKR
jgi:hypothetical protein